MIKNVLSDIGGIGIYGVISICLFFAVFIGALIWSLLLKKADLDSRSMLPLEDGARPSPAAETPEGRPEHEFQKALDTSLLSAPGDGRTPSTRFAKPV